MSPYQELSTASDERLLDLLEIYHRHCGRVHVAVYRFNMVLQEVESRGLEIPEWVYESPYLA